KSRSQWKWKQYQKEVNSMALQETEQSPHIENMDEFDAPTMMGSAYCSQLTEEQFNQQGASETEKALMQLMSHLDKNPSVYKKLLEKKKQEDIENAGVMSFIKAKFLSSVQGESYEGNKVTEQETIEKLDDLKENMVKAFNYAQESKGTRFSKRLAAKRTTSQTSIKSVGKSRPKKQKSKTRIPPPPPALPPRGLAPPPPPPPPLPVAVTPLKDNKNIMTSTPAAKGSKPLQVCSGPSTRASVHSEILQSNPLKRLKSTTALRSPGGTPIKQKSTPRGSLDGSLNISGFDHEEPLMRSFLKIMHQKFRNIRTPSPGPSSSRNNSVLSPLAYSPGDFSP
ncbi:unnamed protein product, partial [Owenia fusiformis]